MINQGVNQKMGRSMWTAIFLGAVSFAVMYLIFVFIGQVQTYGAIRAIAFTMVAGISGLAPFLLFHKILAFTLACCSAVFGHFTISTSLALYNPLAFVALSGGILAVFIISAIVVYKTVETTTTKTNFCTSCSASICHNAKFCTKCGKQIN